MRRLTQQELKSVNNKKLLAELSTIIYPPELIPKLIEIANSNQLSPRKLTESELATIGTNSKSLKGRYFSPLYIPLILQSAKEITDINPRKLLPNEIEDILSIIPPIMSSNKEVSETLTRSFKDRLRTQLTNIDITPLAIPMLKQQILSQFLKARVTPGTAVGNNAAEALGAQITQMTLNTFHAAGSAKNISAGVGRISEVLKASKEPKIRSCSIHFKDNTITLEQILREKRSEFVEIKIDNLIVDYNIELRSQLFQTEPEWYGLYRNLIRFDVPVQDMFVLRLEIDKYLLYSHDIDMMDIATEIESGGSVIAVFSPLFIGIIDVYVIPGTIEETTSEIDNIRASIVFLENVVIPKILDMKIRGIQGITGLYPVSEPVLSIVSGDVELSKGYWLMKWNKSKLYSSGIKPQNLTRLVQVSGLQVLGEYNEGLLVNSDIAPNTFIRQKIDEEMKKATEYEDAERKRGVLFPQAPISDIVRASEFYYADTLGSNYRDILARDDVDTTFTVSNDVHEIYETLGIEAARNFLITEILRIIKAQDSYVNIRHIVLIADFMTNRGKVLGITYYGVQHQTKSSLALASIERSLKVFAAAAARGKKDNITSTSTAIYVGQRPKIGSGMFDVIAKEEPIVSNVEIEDAVDLLEDAMLAEPITEYTQLTQEEVFKRITPVTHTVKEEKKDVTIIDKRVTPSNNVITSSIPIVSNQLVGVYKTVEATGIPCLPKLDQTIINRPFNYESQGTLPINNTLTTQISKNKLIPKSVNEETIIKDLNSK
jgi:hypothetical protein